MPIVELRDRPSPPFANKRRIITPENEPRDYPGANGTRGSPRHQQHGLGLYSSGEAYPASGRGVLYHPEPIRSPVFDPTRAGDYRANPYPPRERGPYPEYAQSQYPPPQYDQAPPGYSSPVYAYGYDSRGQHLQERSAYPPGYHGAEYTHGHHEPYLNELGAGQVHDLKGPQRKRRGNLPKETTDKLRSWFVAHLHHPYPTEDEKQELMMQTGLQMSEFPPQSCIRDESLTRLPADQISNWFINARRRQLPTMISNARAESDARSARAHDAANMQGGSESDDETSYGEDYEPERDGRKGAKNEKL